MALTRDNHFVPQFYLKNFATSSGTVCEYRTLVSHSNVPLWKPVNVAGTGYERNLYTRIVRGEEADDIEQWLNCEFETPAREPLHKVLSDKTLTRTDWEILVRFLASQFVRTPAFLIKNLPLWNQMTPGALNRALEDVVARLHEAKASGKRIILDPAPHLEYFPMRTHRAELRGENKVQLGVTVVVGHALWFYVMKHALTHTIKVLHKHNWTLLEAPIGSGWFTSDDPVICVNFRTESDYDFAGGWNSPRGNILFPLTSRHIMFTEIGAGPHPSRYPSLRQAMLFRRMIAEHAHRRVYSLGEDGRILQFRPRVVDPIAFQNERALWEAFYEDQSRAEQGLQIPGIRPTSFTDLSAGCLFSLWATR
jgi:Protein of unknown function (DUF4238)